LQAPGVLEGTPHPPPCLEVGSRPSPDPRRGVCPADFRIPVMAKPKPVAKAPKPVAFRRAEACAGAPGGGRGQLNEVG
jgi:hypothetical protein